MISYKPIDFKSAVSWYNEGGRAREIALLYFDEGHLRIGCEEYVDMKRICGYEFSDGEYKRYNEYDVHMENIHVFNTLEQCESSVAMAMLSQLMAIANGGWSPDWDDAKKEKFVILFRLQELDVVKQSVDKSFLAFKDKHTAVGFLNIHEKLIKQYYNYA